MRDLYEYDVLIEQFITKKIGISEFERLYMDKFLNETTRLGDALFHPLDYLFAEVNLYTGYPLEPDDDPDWHISEVQLRETARKTLEEIRALP